MNWYNVLQSILTYCLTTFAVACLTWAAKTSKRITKLEEHETVSLQTISQLSQVTSQHSESITKLDERDKIQTESLNKLDKMLENQVETNTKLDLLLSGKLKISAGGEQ